MPCIDEYIPEVGMPINDRNVVMTSPDRTPWILRVRGVLSTADLAMGDARRAGYDIVEGGSDESRDHYCPVNFEPVRRNTLFDMKLNPV